MDISLLEQGKWRLIDHSEANAQFHALQSFAIDDTLCMSVGSGYSPPTVRAWVHRPTVVLGIQDTKLKALEKGIAYIESQNYEWIVRNSGGLAVALDEGVLNVSLIFPDTEKGININRGYDCMWTLIRLMLQDFGKDIKAGEIIGSYCPGSYDLSIGGRKFAGISQRRIRKGVAVQIYVCVSGSGMDRAELVKSFYHYAQYKEPSKFVFPSVEPSVMASLSELLHVDLTVKDVMKRLIAVLQSFGGHLFMDGLKGEELGWFQTYYERMVERNSNLSHS